MTGHSRSIILPTSYLPSISYFTLINNYSSVFIERQEYYIKQSIRNHTIILGPNGNQKLTVPIERKGKSKKIIKDLKIANNLWKKKHLQAIKTAYGNSPFFIHYFEEVNKLINKNYVFLFDLNQSLLNFFLTELEINKKITSTENYIKNYDNKHLDFRNNQLITQNKKHLYYQQTFESKSLSLENYSIIDLLFNLGNESKNSIISTLKKNK